MRGLLCCGQELDEKEMHEVRGDKFAGTAGEA
jgi:hypothetical protein